MASFQFRQQPGSLRYLYIVVVGNNPASQLYAKSRREPAQPAGVFRRDNSRRTQRCGKPWRAVFRLADWHSG